ncbi:uncharacterized protein LOC100626715 [Sus scrofa]|uniref:uncharacterized protein LOC100626715 n=1 Tax=Sus scrofa TaxID=9823 RepID=UPI000A2B0372|nr:uncharacterized protein LOC100626715 [Sus scrofa]
MHAAVGQRRAVAAHRARDGAWRAVPGRRAQRAFRRGGSGGGGGAELQLGQALLAEGVQTRQQLGRAPVCVEVVVADLALVVLERREAGDRHRCAPGSGLPTVPGSHRGASCSCGAPRAAGEAPSSPYAAVSAQGGEEALLPPPTGCCRLTGEALLAGPGGGVAATASPHSPKEVRAPRSLPVPGSLSAVPLGPLKEASLAAVDIGFCWTWNWELRATGGRRDRGRCRLVLTLRRESLPNPKKEGKEDGSLGPCEMGMFPLSLWILCKRQQDTPGDIGGKDECIGIKLKEEKEGKKRNQ